MGDPADIPHGSRFRRESVQIATRILKKHSRVPRVRFMDQDPVIEEIPPPMEVPPKRSDSPTISQDDDEDDLSITMTNSPVGILGFILDLYRLQRDDYLDAMTLSESLSTHRTSSSSNRAARSQESSATGPPGQSRLSDEIATTRGLTRVPH